MINALAWIGARAHWMLAGGVVLCFVAPELSRALRPALPFLVPVVLGLAMARIDFVAAARDAARPRAALGLITLTLALMPLSAALYLGLARFAGLDPDLAAALVYLAAAPPIASAGSICFMLGYDARRAIEVTIAATLLTPLVGPLTVEILLPEATPLSPVVLGRNLGMMVLGGAALAAVIRAAVGPARIAADARAFDGLAVLALVALVLPLFSGVPALIGADPARAGVALVVAVLVNFGVNFLLRAALARRAAPQGASAYGVLFGNRTVAMYVAALPHDPQLTLFVALYQIPILLTPLVLRRMAHTRN